MVVTKVKCDMWLLPGWRLTCVIVVAKVNCHQGVIITRVEYDVWLSPGKSMTCGCHQAGV